MVPSQMPAISNTSEHDNLTERREVRRRREQRELLQQEQLQQQQHQWYHEPRRRHYSNFSERLDSFEESMDELDKEPLLEAYMWEKMDPKERWEQEQINELEKTHVIDPFEQLIFMQDELEQSEQIDRLQRLQEEEEQTQLKQWEQEQLIEQNQADIIAYVSQVEDDIEQLKQIDAVQKMGRDIDRRELQLRQKEPDDVELFQLEQWEDIVFLVQQLN
ncbi:unnamed protein product [Adineta steineri]|uniref:Uncharacterized protein n=1 Tax=Adineta steineri TaxID=433720 RepID=A0A819VN61_9BILA|nr:unnamed protein product [Adineta steineri]CAF4111161.1 unnamed protein product [Adineta steineri]